MIQLNPLQGIRKSVVFYLFLLKVNKEKAFCVPQKKACRNRRQALYFDVFLLKKL